MPRWSVVHLATLLYQRQVVPILLRLGLKHFSFLLPTQLQAWGSFRVAVPYAFERSSWTGVSVGLFFRHPRTILARTSAPLGVVTENCPMCCAFPSLFVLLGSAFIRSFRCILSSINVPCASFTSASVRAIGLTRVPSLCQVVQSVLRSMLSFLGVRASLWSKPLSTPQLLGALPVLLRLLLCDGFSGAAPALSTRILLLTAPVAISGTLHLMLFASFLALSSSVCSSFVTSIATMLLFFRPCLDCLVQGLFLPAFGMLF